MFIVHTMHDCWVYLKMGLPPAYDDLKNRQISGRTNLQRAVFRDAADHAGGRGCGRGDNGL